MIKWGALAIATTVAATALVSSAGAAPQGASSATVNLSSRAAASTYLLSLGLNPHGFVIQRGAHNYAGPNCPGKGWTCTTSTRVLQVAQQAGRTNSVNCDAPSGIVTDQTGDCEIVQVTSEGGNTATCTQSSNDPNASQDCDLFQTNSSGTNTVNVDQQISTGNESNISQNLTQSISVRQDNVTGSNVAHVTHQTASASVFGCCSGSPQSQDASQSLSLTQKATSTGDNSTDIVQSLTENADASVNDGQSITQTQNTNTQSPNTNTGITQTSGSGKNSVTLSQTHNLSETASNSNQIVTQTQGSPVGGLNAVVSQSSTGVSTYSNTQNENQTQDASNNDATIVETQYGPQWMDPTQSNPSDTISLTQSSNQQATQPSLQNDQEYEQCDTAGICNAGQGITQGDSSFGNSCGPTNSCDIGLIVINGFKTTCSTDCPPGPPPPLPENPSTTTPPSCALIGTIAGPPKQIKIQVQDAQGLATITADTTNASYSVPPYVGLTTPVVVTATKTPDQSKSSFIRLTITDTAGLTTVCDPIVPAVRTHKHKQRRA